MNTFDAAINAVKPTLFLCGIEGQEYLFIDISFIFSLVSKGVFSLHTYFFIITMSNFIETYCEL